MALFEEYFHYNYTSHCIIAFNTHDRITMYGQPSMPFTITFPLSSLPTVM